ncbi:MAG: hypothetical protein LBR58_06020 [Propionibacteriaceae bacterium]|jgi:hypothetical protein|nr:hypothetical protein [Propionibacteriaceae bacterium]
MPRPIRWLLIAILVAGLGAGGIAAYELLTAQPLPISERCEATVGSYTTTVDVEQAQNAALIAGMSIKRGLIPRAASIALATAYQESKIRNLDYGHADSIGLFQQRPSKGWGTIEEIMDPWYSTKQFYKTMEKVKNWQTRDINDVAQAVQRSAFPEAYRQHESNARTLASSLTGETPASFSCAITPGDADAKSLKSFYTKTYGKEAIKVETTDTGLLVTAQDTQTAWSVAEAAVANAKRYGVAKVQVDGQSWAPANWEVPQWQVDPTAPEGVTITLVAD